MRFTFLDIIFSIGFYHDKPRACGDHIGHPVSLQKFEGKTTVYCEKCALIIGNVPKRLRKRKTYCTIKAHINGDWIAVFTGIGSPNEKEGDRFTKEIGRRAALSNALLCENFVVVDSRSNLTEPSSNLTQVGMERLSNLRATFKEAAWACFNGRKK